ncbi:MAG: hypothetical protein FWG15_06900 [Propionibacteriaceae bacterium]|nr:hypothetical protein [Propionibacteriaceae bacterium]
MPHSRPMIVVGTTTIMVIHETRVVMGTKPIMGMVPTPRVSMVIVTVTTVKMVVLLIITLAATNTMVVTITANTLAVTIMIMAPKSKLIFTAARDRTSTTVDTITMNIQVPQVNPVPQAPVTPDTHIPENITAMTDTVDRTLTMVIGHRILQQATPQERVAWRPLTAVHLLPPPSELTPNMAPAASIQLLVKVSPPLPANITAAVKSALITNRTLVTTRPKSPNPH